MAEKGELDDGLVEKKRFANVLDFRNGAFEVEGFGEHDLEDLGDHRVS